MMALRKDMERVMLEAYEQYKDSHIENHWARVAAADIIANSRIKTTPRKERKEPFYCTSCLKSGQFTFLLVVYGYF